MGEKHFGLRIDETLLAKFRYACSYEDRSANSQILQLIKKFVDDYEKANGKISPEDIYNSINKINRGIK